MLFTFFYFQVSSQSSRLCITECAFVPSAEVSLVQSKNIQILLFVERNIIFFTYIHILKWILWINIFKKMGNYTSQHQPQHWSIFTITIFFYTTAEILYTFFLHIYTFFSFSFSPSFFYIFTLITLFTFQFFYVIHLEYESLRTFCKLPPDTHYIPEESV